jgi:hypothetical protein
MTRRREDEFPYYLSSAGCRDVYPENRPGNFKILLKDPIEFPPDEEWEVGLLDVHYPFTFQNVGKTARTQMIFVADTTVHEVHFPEWQCANLKDLVKYIKGEIDPITNRYKLYVDDLGRFRMESTTLFCDVGFSDSLRRLLGLTENDPTIFYETASRRASHWKVLSRFWKNNKNPLDTDERLFSIIWSELNATELAKKLKDYLDTDMFFEDPDPDVQMMEKADLAGVAKAFGVYLTPELELNFRAFEYAFRQLYQVEDVPPGMLISSYVPQMVPIQQMFIYTNIIQPIDVNDETENLLKIVDVQGGKNGRFARDSLANPVYQSVERGRKITMIHVYIKDEFGNVVSFQNGTLFMRLHFRKQRYRR